METALRLTGTSTSTQRKPECSYLLRLPFERAAFPVGYAPDCCLAGVSLALSSGFGFCVSVLITSTLVFVAFGKDLAHVSV